MDLTLTSDQAALMSALDQLAARFEGRPVDFQGFALLGRELEAALEDGQFFDIALVPDFGPLCAAMAVERLSRLPYTAEIALSMLVRPHLGREIPRPLALVEDGRPGRFVSGARTVLIADSSREELRVAHPTPESLQAVASIYAYPMGKLTDTAGLAATGTASATAGTATTGTAGATAAGAAAGTPLTAEEAANIRVWLRIALAAEISGLLHAAIAATAEYVNDRKQFGRPLATFQALRHRLAECAVLAGGTRWLALRAAWTGDAGDAALAALHAQQSATQVVYDVHQMLGGMGITLEHSMHLWTYRLKALLSELGGRAGQSRAVLQHCFN